MAELHVIFDSTVKVLCEFGPVVLVVLFAERVTRRGA